MGKFCVIGVGRFGYHCSRSLFERENDVVIIDNDRDKVNKIRDYCSQAIVGNATDRDLLKPLALDEKDAVIVSTGSDISVSILATLYLKELNARTVIVKAIDEDHANILKKVGADRIIFPEKEMALKTAQVLSDPNLADYVPLSGDYIIAEIPVPDKLVGKTIKESRIRNKYLTQIIALRIEQGGRTELSPVPDRELNKGEIMIVLGRRSDVNKLKDL